MDMDEVYKDVEDDKEIGGVYKGSAEERYDKEKEKEDREWEMGLSDENKEILSPTLEEKGKEEVEKKRKEYEIDGVEEDGKDIGSDTGMEMM